MYMHTCTCQLSWFSQESPSFSSNLPVPWLEHQISWGKTYHGLFQKFFVNFLMFEKWKRKLKQEVDLVLSCSWSENIKQGNQIVKYLTSIVIGQKPTKQIAQFIVESWRGFCMLLSTLETFRRPLGDFQRVFRHGRKWHSFNSPLVHLPYCTSFAVQNFAWALFSISPGTTVIPRSNEKQRLCKILGGK